MGRLQRRLGPVRHRAADALRRRARSVAARLRRQRLERHGKSATSTTSTSIPGPASPPPEDESRGRAGRVRRPRSAAASATPGKTKRTGAIATCRRKEELNEGYLKLLDGLRPLIADPGLSAAVYTQTTDVEIEVNGLMTYDREVIKVDEHAAAAAAARLYLPPPAVQTIVPTSEQIAAALAVHAEHAATKWALPEFDDDTWTRSPRRFSAPAIRRAPSSARCGTRRDIWLRRRFTLGDVDRENVFLRLHHDEDADVYLNGVLAAKVTGYTTDYQLVPIAPRARAGATQRREHPGRSLQTDGRRPIHRRRAGRDHRAVVGRVAGTEVASNPSSAVLNRDRRLLRHDVLNGRVRPLRFQAHLRERLRGAARPIDGTSRPSPCERSSLRRDTIPGRAELRCRWRRSRRAVRRY